MITVFRSKETYINKHYHHHTFQAIAFSSFIECEEFYDAKEHVWLRSMIDTDSDEEGREGGRGYVSKIVAEDN